jgi:uncharacterized protein (TIGR02099 family)
MLQPDQAESSAAPPAEEAFSPLAELGFAPARRSLVRRLLRFFGIALLVLYFGFAAAVLVLRFWILPEIEAHPEAVAEIVSRNIGQRVSIGSVDSGWQRLRPFLAMTDVRLYDQDGRVALSLPSVSCTLAWDSLAFGALRFDSLSLDKPQLAVRRDKEGMLHIAGVTLDPGAAGGGFADWLLAQREVTIRDAFVSWEDQLRQAPLLALTNLNFVMRNRGSHHRFALRALPPRELATALDLRGDLEGGTFEQLQAWNGKLYAELVYADLAVWRTWVDYPLEINKGQGGLRMWLGFADKRLEDATADVSLSNISARLAPELPLLEMGSLQGRLSAKRMGGGYDVAGKQVSLALQTGESLPPTQFALQWRPGGDKHAEQGELKIDALELQPLAIFGEYLPLPQAVRKILAEAAPKGSITDMRFDWQGPLPNPQRYSVRGRFDQLGMRAYARLPGFTGVSGNIDGNENGGSVLLNAVKSSVELPHVFADPERKFDTLTAQLVWSHMQGELQLKLSNIAFANTDLAGTAFGTYTTAPEGPGVIDFTARLNRSDARATARYIPFLKQTLLDWLDRALLAGHTSEVGLRLKGNLKDFPFQGTKGGVFQITAKVVDGTLRYAQAWPLIEDINAELHFDGKRMEVISNKASVLGARLTHTHVIMPDLFTPDRVLAITGQAEGPTAEFLNFIRQSPVNGMTGGFTGNMGAVGSGKLQLKLDLPLVRLAETRVAGNYQFAGNQVSIDAGWPAVTQASGRLDFSENSVNMRAVNAQFLGGPVAVSIASQRDGVVAVNARGTLNAAFLPGALELPLLRQLGGTTSWNSSVSIRKRVATIVVESELQGIASALPAPLNKAPPELLPLRFVRTVFNDEQRSGGPVPPSSDRSTLELGNVVRMEVQRRRDAGTMVIERAAVGLNEAPRLPEKGTVINGSAPELDLDQWLHVLEASGGKQAPLSALNLKVGALDVYGKRINDVTLRAGFQGSDWLANIDARELAGTVRWRSQGKGRVSAQLSHFTFPEPTPGKSASEAPPKELPGLDIVADNLVVRDKKLGRLELAAVNEGRDWRIEKLALTTPESQLIAEGLWQVGMAQQRTNLNLKLDVSDIGKYLERVGYPGSMQRGNAKMLGKLAWAGSPQSIDYATLAGDLSLIAEKGQFLKIEPGIGKLLGILSLQALPRRITLDFRDIFSDGFAFDKITGTATIAKGVLRTQDFAMIGPSAQVAMKGDIDLAQETQTLRVRVVPSVGDAISVAGLVFLANPITGVASFLAQRLFKDPLGQVFAFEYAISGNWADPKVEKVSRGVQPGAENGKQ